MASNIAYKPFKCATCGQQVEAGQPFVWGPYGSKTRFCTTCGTGTKPVAVAEKPISLQQQVAVDWAIQSVGNASLEAVAGSGKTTTLEAICRALVKTNRTITIRYNVFNAANAREAQERMPVGVDAGTFHSFGYNALKHRLNLPSNHKPDGKKLSKVLDHLVEKGQVLPREADNLGDAALKLVALAKRHAVGAVTPDVESKWIDLLSHYGITVEVDPEVYAKAEEAEARCIEIARLLLKESNRQTEVIDFDDMLYLVLLLNVRTEQFDFVLVDEAQDSNPARRAMLRLMLKPGGRLLVVGDRRQAIYGFTGAEADAMDKLAEEFNCTSLPLSVNYRCSRAVIDVAKQFCPEIEAHDGAVEGSVEYVPTMKITDFRPTDAVLCRCNAPLMKLAYQCITAGVPVEVKGKADVMAGLVTLIKKMKASNMQQLEKKLQAYLDREMARWTAKGEAEKAASAQDKVDCIFAAIEALPEGETHVNGLLAHIERVFGGAEADGGPRQRLLLSSIHKSKGLEWAAVYILDPHLMPGRWAKKDWELEQENNLMYVSATRAKVDLRYVSLEDITR